MTLDLLIKRGRLFDATQDLTGEICDVGIVDGRVASVQPDIPTSQAKEVIDAQGLLVAPGLIDLHVHVYDGVGVYGVDADTYCLRRGVTTALDTGSAGALTFPGLRKYVIDKAKTRVYALLHIAEQGIVSRNGELLDLRNANVEESVRVVNANRDVILGMKIRLGKRQVGEHAPEALALALEAAEATGLPLMIHVSDLAMPVAEMLDMLRPGDILTHCFEQQSKTVLDHRGSVSDAIRKAVDRGIVLDVGHGMGSFSLPVAKQALADGLAPHTISSDIHALNIDGPVYDQVTTLAKFLSLGMSLEDVIEKSTSACARAINLPDDLGHLRPGARADVTVLSLEEGAFQFEDSMGNAWDAEQNLRTRLVVKDGELVADYRKDSQHSNAAPVHPDS